MPAAGEHESDPAFAELQRRVDDYLALRERVERMLKPLETTASAAELAARQDSLAAAIQEARRDAKPGDLIPRPAADAIRAIIAADYQHRAPETRAGALEDEAPDEAAVGVNRVYPPDAALVTVPPLLLAKLPILPDNLQYRLVERHLVLLDGDTRLVLDVVRDALPPF